MEKKNSNRKRRKFARREKPEFEQSLLDLARVTRVVKGGRRFRFRATVVIGNRKGKVGVGVAKGTDVSQAIQKAFEDAKKKMITVHLAENTIPHEIKHKLGSAKVLLKPAPEGRGIIAGGAVRTVVDLLGVRDIVSKSFGTSNKLNVARATISALSELALPKDFDPEKAKAEESKGKKAGNRRDNNDKSGRQAAPLKAKAKKDDNLTRIEGIGPKIAELLMDNGIKTFAKLADTEVKMMQDLLDENSLGAHKADTWPEQSKLAAAGKWSALQRLQDELMGGKESK